MRKNLTRFNIRLDCENGHEVKEVRGYLIDLPFGYTGVVHRKFGYDAADYQKYWVVSEFFTGCAVTFGCNGETRKQVIDFARYLICKAGLATFENGIKEFFTKHKLDEIN